MSKSDELMVSVVAELVAMIENGGTGDSWAMPWNRLGGDLLSPTNARTHKPYTGGNRWVLAIAAMAAELTGGTWATYRQWSEIGAQVRKGETALAAVRRPVPHKRTETDPDTGEQTETERIAWRTAVVFHSSQVDDWNPAEVELADHDPIEAAEQMATAWAAAGMTIIEDGDRAYYSPSTDTVHVPNRGLFPLVDHFYSTLAHEAGHWTGPRLDRDLTGRFGDDAYAAEELIAELSAAIVGAAIGLDPASRNDHAQYLAGWLRILRADPSHLYTAASAAEAAAAHLLDLAPTAKEAVA